MNHKKTVGFMGGKFLPLHQGHIYAIVEASNKVEELYLVLSSSKKRDREICKRDGIRDIPADIRLSWLGETFNNIDNIKIIHIEDNQWEEDYNWEQGAKMIKEAIGKPIDYVFSSETTYNNLFAKNYPNSKHVIIDDKRKTVTISATQLRKKLFEHWDKLPREARGYFTKRVVIVGTESTGKSTLVKQLSKFYNTNFVHEVGREYCKKYSNKLTEEMFDSIAMEHFLLQEKLAGESNKVLFIDSDAVITQYYLGMYFNGKKSSLIEEIIRKQDYDLVIYLEPDVKWVDDGLRFAGNEAERKKNNAKLKKMYREAGIPFVCVDGNYNERFNKARQLIEKLFEGK